jgi:sulfhydrogenase subunit alpha
VEGHGGVFVKIEGDRVVEVNMDIHEGSRYYEKLLVGRNFLEVQGIITRVCAICSANHTVTALMALEDALGIEETEHVRQLRGLMLLGAAIESHSLHVFALALPDYLGFDSVMSMAAAYPEEVTAALRLKQLGNRVQELVGGRPVHPVNALVGGFGKIPGRGQLRDLREQLTEAVESAMAFVDLAASIEVPGWAARPTLFLALRPDGPGYRFRGSTICTSRGDEHPISDYLEVVREFSVDHSRARHAALATGESYMVGALARLSLWGDRLTGRALEAYRVLFPNGAEDDILLNNWAQLVEIVHSLERGIEICDAMIATAESPGEVAAYDVRAGRGIAAVEVPRGTLFHDYQLDDQGRVASANIITPTAQNLLNAERDLRFAVEGLLASGTIADDELSLDLAMVARAYDPCISCSVHVVRVNP